MARQGAQYNNDLIRTIVSEKPAELVHESVRLRSLCESRHGLSESHGKVPTLIRSHPGNLLLGQRSQLFLPLGQICDAKLGLQLMGNFNQSQLLNSCIFSLDPNPVAVWMSHRNDSYSEIATPQGAIRHSRCTNYIGYALPGRKPSCRYRSFNNGAGTIETKEIYITHLAECNKEILRCMSI